MSLAGTTLKWCHIHVHIRLKCEIERFIILENGVFEEINNLEFIFRIWEHGYYNEKSDVLLIFSFEKQLRISCFQITL